MDGGDCSGLLQCGWIDRSHPAGFGAHTEVRIVNYAGVAIGKDTSGYAIRTDNTGAGTGGDIIVTNIAGSIETDGDLTTRGGYSGGIFLYCGGDVRIGDAMLRTLATGGANGSGGNFTARHQGAFAGGYIDTGGNRDGPACSVQCDGGNNSGTFSVQGISTEHGSSMRSSGDITIRNYASVKIGANTNGVSLCTIAPANSGAILITNITGDIRIDGKGSLDGGTVDGTMLLQSVGGGIVLGTVDLNLLAAARLEFARSCVVTGAVSNLATNYTGGAGQPLDPYVTTQTKLRAAFGKKIMYHPEVSGNAYLGGASWRVADLAGAAGQGGVLTPYQARGTVVMMK
jgi:hypothetical protein